MTASLVDKETEILNNLPKDQIVTATISIDGIVQGVGFRPTVWRYANERKINGTVSNNNRGVTIQCTAQAGDICDFIEDVVSKPPPLAKINRVISQVKQELKSFDGFVISQSETLNAPRINSIGADMATCKDCLNDIKQKGNRYQYAFTNCTNCGPRLSICFDSPYDRVSTSMHSFTMCKSCNDEYSDPSDRRFHAQPNACKDCGPTMWLARPDGSVIENYDPVSAIVDALRSGKIAAIKGIGGFHLAVLASDGKAIAKLRERKHRPHKPFAVMFADVASAQSFVHINQQEKQLLESPEAPIILLQKKAGIDVLPGVAPSQSSIGVFLPTTAYHHMLMEKLEGPIVMTSGNPHGHPQAITNETALDCLQNIADIFLLHNRDIVHRVDDSVSQIVLGETQILRRARGYAPNPIKLPQGFENTMPVLAMGADLKNTACFLTTESAIPTQHFGDLDNAQTLDEYLSGIETYQRFLDLSPKVIAVDQHPDYQSSRAGHEYAKNQNIIELAVQHHHAHIAACMGENRYPKNDSSVIGIVLDGLGFAQQDTKHNLWGAEIMLANYVKASNLGGLSAVELIGGDKANRQPWRNALAHLDAALGWQKVTDKYFSLPSIKRLMSKPVSALLSMKKSGFNSPLSSSCGRLFDAVSYIVDCFIDDELTFEAQAAMALQSAVQGANWDKLPAYSFGVTTSDSRTQINPSAMWNELLDDLINQESQSNMSIKFHKGIAKAFSELAIAEARERKIDTVVLSGGVFANDLLLREFDKLLKAKNMQVLTHSKVPCNDGGIALGQALIAAARCIEHQPGDQLCV